MKVLSLFDGISCGIVALERAGIKVDRYVAYEIDKYAIKVSQSNYPTIEQYGDVTTADFKSFKGFDLLLGGSPCTFWSIAKKDRETTPSGLGWDLFMHYKRALIESECQWFLYENNFGIHEDIQAAISVELGVTPIMINSALVSAQQRKRLYWTNIPNVSQPADKGIYLKNILESGVLYSEKSYTLTASYKIAEPVCVAQYILNDNDGKSQTIKAQYGKNAFANFVRSGTFGATGVAERFVPIRVGDIGSNSQAHRVYSVRGKSVCLSANGGGQGGKTGLYKIDLPDGDYIIRKLTPVECERLQTLPDNYTASISNTRRYKCLGNAWTVDVIAHILQGLKTRGDKIVYRYNKYREKI